MKTKFSLRTLPLAVFAALFSVLARGSLAQATVVDFTNDTVGVKANGFVSTGSSAVSFSDTVGSSLRLGDFGSASFGNAIATLNDDAGAVLMNFTTSMTSLSLAFGNDDPAFTVAGDLGVLTLFLNSVQVSRVSVVLNRDDIMNQTASYAGLPFNSATFQFTSSNPAVPRNLIENVDNVTFAVPEPSPWAVMLGGLGLLGGVQHFRRARRA